MAKVTLAAKVSPTQVETARAAMAATPVQVIVGATKFVASSITVLAASTPAPTSSPTVSGMLSASGKEATATAEESDVGVLIAVGVAGVIFLIVCTSTRCQPPLLFSHGVYYPTVHSVTSVHSYFCFNELG